eukprot:scaffold5436_cov143-Skeletonema_marinoi.AAC.1
MALRHQKDIHLIKSTAERQPSNSLKSPCLCSIHITPTYHRGLTAWEKREGSAERLPNFLATAKYCANPAGELSHMACN